MRLLADIVCKRRNAYVIVVVIGSVAILAAVQAAKLEQEDDLLAFLPEDNPEVQLFHQINDSFGGTDVALVGLEAEDPFDPSFLSALSKTTEHLDDLPTLDHVLSLTNVIDFTPDQELGGIVADNLVAAIPADDEARAALRRKVMSRDHIVGNLISADARAVVIYCYLSYGINPKLVASQIESIVEANLPGVEKYWGGAPFVSTYIYNTVQEDLGKLTPWAVLAIVVIMMLVFRNWIGTSLVLLSTAMGIMISLGVMGFLGIGFNIVLSATPVVLFAIGSAYGLHILARYYSRAEAEDAETALHETVAETGPVVIAAGLTTAVSLLSFALMDIRPVRIFGIFTSLGILVALVLAITFIPAVICLTRLKRRSAAAGVLPRWTAGLAGLAQRRRRFFGAALFLLAVTAAGLVGKVDTRIDMTTFFSRGSPPDRAAKFLRQHFGGSQFIQIRAIGDMNDPDMLRQLRLTADRVSLLPHVASVLHIGDAVALSNNAMVGQRRIPDTTPQVRLLYSFVTTDRSTAQLLTADRDQALLHVKIDSEKAADQERAIAHVTAVTGALAGRFVAHDVAAPRGLERLTDLVTWRIRALAHRYAIAVPADFVSRLPPALAARPDGGDAVAAVAATERFLRSQECAVHASSVFPGDPTGAIAKAAVGLGSNPGEPALAALIGGIVGRPPHDPDVADLAFSLSMPVQEIWTTERARRHAADLVGATGMAVPDGERGDRFRSALTTALLDLDAVSVMVPVTRGTTAAAARNLGFAVNGMPVMHRGMSRSITKNQILSLAFALILVLVIMSVLFRSLVSGLLGIAPTVLTVLVVYGGMGLLGVHLDFGTSMLASLILGAGVDYAVHLLSAWRGVPGQDLAAVAAGASRTTGTAIWTNAVMIAAGFLVLTMGEARPLKNVGGLTAAAMLIASAATFIAIPALARRHRYRRLTSKNDDGTRAEVVEVIAERVELRGSQRK